MRILGIETSTPVISVAVAEDGQLLGEFSLTTKQGHMEHLLPLIDQLLTSLKLSVRDLDGYAASVGPGSFTSLRVGLATCKALAHAGKKFVAEVSTLDVLAWGLQGTEGLICPLIPARRDEVYTAIYVSSAGGIKRLSSYLALNPKDLIERLRGRLQAKITFTGEGAQLYQDLLQQNLKDHAVFADPARIWPRAGFTAIIGSKILTEKGGKKPGAVQALYVKPPAIRCRRS
ncbi:MAG: tRNA (adenosine(37)-N6)-threonylcarbamoyltransferase complex dimerization subunit type 1 TsaB [Thermacetogeniaceae bacterium]|jgi:tRNA threonylcarbamoyladenosine biosynthesis protein TsaB|nr:tRNA (adenosine(37)-N6)-threonylcarbamoyltransferase complex dimerization subunit type 1 TsaB [Syntrophomonadaceae bacterium]